MIGWSESQCLFFCGAAGMAVSVGLGLICTLIFLFTGRKIRRTLEEEYGKLPRRM